jgi:hypothetical protein
MVKLVLSGLPFDELTARSWMNSMNKMILESANAQVDELLELLCIELQITDTQYAKAERSYESVGEWLSKADSPLRPFSPKVFVQGSMSLGTTVKPRKREDFDVDSVCLLQIDAEHADPAHVYKLVLSRILEHELYAKKAEPKERCIRLNYEGDFHLDIIPACPRQQDGHEALVIPDRQKRIWCPSNPKAYVRWFTTRALPLIENRIIQLSVAPLPPNIESGSKTTLQRIVQLLKRRRDVVFNGDGKAPRSILLTTLAAMFYGGEEMSTDAVINILDRLGEQARTRTDIPKVLNPTNPKENFARHWQDDPSEYRKFVEFCAEFRVKMDRLVNERNLQRVGAILNDLFDPTGSGVANRAIKAYAERFQGGRDDKFIRMKTGVGATLTTAATSSLAIPANRFFGD